EIDELGCSLAQMEKSSGRHDELIEADLQFHRTIFRMADNRVCSLMFSIVHESLRRLMELTSQMVDLEHTARLHRRIYSAIRKGKGGGGPRPDVRTSDRCQAITDSFRWVRAQARLGDRL